MDDGTVMGRALAIVETVSQRGPRVGLAELARGVAIPKPTTRRIAEDLARRGVLTRAESGGYSLGPQLERLGSAALLHGHFPGAREALNELHGSCGGVAWLSAGDRIQALQPLDLVCDADLDQFVRSCWPAPESRLSTLVNTAFGRLLLAERTQLIEEVGRIGIPRATAASPRTERDLRAIVRQIHDLGAAVETEQCAVGWRCVAVKMRAWEGLPVVVGVTVPVGHTGIAMLLRAVRRAGAQLSQSDLGGHAPPASRTTAPQR